MKINKSFLSMMLLTAVALLTGCSEDGYWDKASVNGEVAYSFAQEKMDITLSGADNATELEIVVNRNTTAGSIILPITAKVNSQELTCPSEVSFADGSNQAVYKVALGDIKIGVKYTCELAIATEQASASAVSTLKINLSRAYTWISAGTAQFYAGWSGMIGNEGLVGDGVTVAIEKAEGGDGLYRLVSPYYFSEKAAGAEGVKLVEGMHIEFIVDAATGAPVGFSKTTQPMGESSDEDGNYYFAYTPGANKCSFTNNGNMYVANALIGYDEGGEKVSLVWYETIAFIWNKDYPW